VKPLLPYDLKLEFFGGLQVQARGVGNLRHPPAAQEGLF
jgi:hypothetical protein